jgi:hypothetical protein
MSAPNYLQTSMIGWFRFRGDLSARRPQTIQEPVSTYACVLVTRKRQNAFPMTFGRVQSES